MQRISGSLAGSIADEAGIRAGDYLLTIDGKPVLDVLDYQARCAGEELVIAIQKANGRREVIEIDKDADETLGILFEDGLMDEPRQCANGCLFCFVDQLPAGLRKSLYVKDDDWRLSFIMGNYITLTNVSRREFERILDMRPSVLHISVHATDPQLRCRLLSHRSAGDILERLKRLLDAGIRCHTQIVLCPGYNDGAQLSRTLEDLYALGPGILSIAVVPAGLSAHREGLARIDAVSERDARGAIERIGRLQAVSLGERGGRTAFGADELYLRARLPLPPYEQYDDFPQYENGVGMFRTLERSFADALERYGLIDRRQRLTIATGVSAAPLLAQLIRPALIDPDAVDILTVKNRLFGESVTVAGLLGGADFARALQGRDVGEAVLIPAVCLRDGQDTFLDDMTLDELAERIGARVLPVEDDGCALYMAIAGRTMEEDDE